MVAKFAPLVKRQIDFWRSEIDRYGPDHPRHRPSKIATYERLANEFGELLAHLLEHEEGAAPAPIRTDYWPPLPAKPKKPVEKLPVSADDNDLGDLPPELLAELSESARGETDPLIRIIRERGGTATLDEILIDLWRKFQEIGKRPLVANKLYRLSRRQLCWSLPGRKGVYTTIRPVATGPDDSENDEGPDGGTSEPSPNQSGVADLPGGQVKASPVGSSPTTSTSFRLRRKLLDGSSLAESSQLPFANLPKRRP